MNKNAKAFLEVTNVCNLSCSFCHKTARAPRFITKEEFEQLTARLEGRVKYLYFHLMGEPLLHPHICDFIRYAWERGFRPMLTTNGTLLSSRGEELLAALPYKISISLHAPAANAAFCDSSYLDGCLSFASAAASRGCIVALRLWNLGAKDEKENEALLTRLHEVFPDAWERVRDGTSLRLAERIFLEWGERFDWPDLAAEPLPDGAPLFCYALRDQIGIHADGTVVPCCLDAEGTLSLGNLFSASLDEILSSARARAVYDGFTAHRATEALCRRCGYARRFCK